MPLAAVPDDPMVLERLEAFNERYGYEFPLIIGCAGRESGLFKLKGRV